MVLKYSKMAQCIKVNLPEISNMVKAQLRLDRASREQEYGISANFVDIMIKIKISSTLRTYFIILETHLNKSIIQIINKEGIFI